MKRLMALAALALSLLFAACSTDGGGASGAPGLESPNSVESPAISSPGVSSAEPMVSPSASSSY